MSDPTILIIGGGIAGLSAGCYAQMNGYSSRILEMHDKPGGLCTAWSRKGYTIDGCLHWLVGSSPTSGYYRMWEELGVVQGRQFVNLPEYLRVERRDGEPLVFWSDLAKMREEMLRIAPEDRALIREFCGDMMTLAKSNLPTLEGPMDLYGPLELAKLGMQSATFLRLSGKWGKYSIADFCRRLRNPFLREAFMTTWFPQSQFFFLMMTFVWLHRQEAGYALGGSLPIAEAIAGRYQALGGEIHTGTRVSRIRVEGNRAMGVLLADGTEERADIVISAADGHATLFDMIEWRFMSDQLRQAYKTLEPFPPLVYLAFGVNDPLGELPHSVTGVNFPLERPLVIQGRTAERISLHAFNHDPTMAPPGKTVVLVMLETDYEPWVVLHEDATRYQAEKERIAGEVLQALDHRLPGFAGKVEMTDVATPITFVRFTGNWRGSFEGWLATPGKWNKSLPQTLPGLNNFYMAGHWLEPGGGLPPAATSGRGAIQRICHHEGKHFQTSLPPDRMSPAQT